MKSSIKFAICMGITCVFFWVMFLSDVLHLPAIIQQVGNLGMFVPMFFAYYYFQKMKKEKNMPSTISPPPATPIAKEKTRKLLILMMVLGSLVTLSAPFWLPFVETPKLSLTANIIIGLNTTVIYCAIFGFQLWRLKKTV